MGQDGSGYVEIPQSNKNRIYNLIRKQGNLSRQDVAFELRLSLPTVVQSITELIGDGLVYESGSLGNTGGRRAKTYSASEKVKVAVGLDITRNHITMIVIDMIERIVFHERVRCVYENNERYYHNLGNMVKQKIAQLDVSEGQVAGVGIALPSLITEDNKAVYYGKILNNYGLTAKDFEEHIPYPCRLYNDANAAGVAEFRLNTEVSDMFYISLSNNVGGAVVINGEIYQGDCSRSGEFGHMTIVPNGRKCYCGKRGCLETYCSATLLSNHTEGNLSAFFERLSQGDAICKKEWEQYLKYLAIGVNNVRMLFDCTVIIGGYVGAHMDEYLEKLRDLVKELTPFENNADYIHVCKYKTEAIAAGAALPLIDDVINAIQ